MLISATTCKEQDRPRCSGVVAILEQAQRAPPLTHYETTPPNMRQICRFIQKLWNNVPCRMLTGASLAVVLGVGAGRVFIGSVYVVEGASMDPAYPPGAHLYGAPISTPVERGDVVLLDDGKDDYAVKRIIGLPGETVQLWRGRVFINRRMLVEPYLPKHTYTYPVEQMRRGATFILGEGQYFVLGDNRTCSSDSRVYGPVGRKQIKRRVPSPDEFICAYFAPYTLPAYGKSLIQPAVTNLVGAKGQPRSGKPAEDGLKGKPAA
jgi:signal peptidase I